MDETVVTKEQQQRLADNIAARKEVAAVLELIGDGKSEKFWALNRGRRFYDRIWPHRHPR